MLTHIKPIFPFYTPCIFWCSHREEKGNIDLIQVNVSDHSFPLTPLAFQTLLRQNNFQLPRCIHINNSLFVQPPYKYAADVSTPYFKINTPLFCCPLFSNEYLNPQVRISKMENECNVDYQPSSSGVTSGISLPYFYRPFSALYLSRIFFEFSFKPL